MYSDFAYVYDLLMQDVNYSMWADYIETLFSRFGLKSPEIVLDLACGTGSLTLELAKRGYDIIGIDKSEDMLSCAAEKASDAGLSLLWVCQDMRDFELYGTVDAILCTMDSLNYIQNKSDMKRVLGLVKNYLNPNGLFIFDMNTPYKLENVLGNNVFYEIRDDVAYLWRTQYNSDEKKCNFDLTLFVRETEGIYRRIDEEQEQKAWSTEEMRLLLSKSGFEKVEVFDAFTQNPPSDISERYFYVACA